MSTDLPAFQNPPRNCPDWFYATGSNVSVAKDRSSFISYTPFESHVEGIVGGSVPVSGIGTIAIRVALPRQGRGREGGSNVITVEDVLHTPTCRWNVLGCDFAPDSDRFVDLGDLKLKSYSGDILGLLEEHPRIPLIRLKLHPPPLVASQLGQTPDVAYCVSVLWSDSERQRWAQFNEGVLPLTPEEKKWLKDNYRGNFHFLASYGLSIYKEDDVQEGRQILRAIMARD